MKILCMLFAVIALPLATVSHAAIITIDPDDYAEGTLLTGAFDSVNLYTSEGGNVYASRLMDPATPPEGFIDSGAIGQRVFSKDGANNSEWMLNGLSHPAAPSSLSHLLDSVSGALVFEFLKPVDYVSIFSMECFSDAGWGFGSDPQAFWVFGSDGGLLGYQGWEGPNKTSLPTDFAPLGTSPYAHFENRFSFADIGYLVVGGDSEPTTLDRLSFRTTSVAEPSTLALSFIAMFGLWWRRKRCENVG